MYPLSCIWIEGELSTEIKKNASKAHYIETIDIGSFCGSLYSLEFGALCAGSVGGPLVFLDV